MSLSALALMRVGIGEALHMAVLVADDAPEVRADLGFGPPFSTVWQVAHFLKSSAPWRRIGGGQQAADRLHRRGAARARRLAAALALGQRAMAAWIARAAPPACPPRCW